MTEREWTPEERDAYYSKFPDDPVMETPEEFVKRLVDDTIGVDISLAPKLGNTCVEVVRARDNAVRLALLDELEARSAAMIPHPMREQIAKLRLKYTPPRGKL